MKTQLLRHRVTRSGRKLLVSSLLVLVAGRSADAAEILARAGSSEISVEEVRGQFEALAPSDQVALSKAPVLLSQFVRAQITRKALLGEVASKKFDQQPAVKLQLERAREQMVMDLFLDSVSKPPDAYPSDADIQAAYAANKAALEVPRQFRVAQIYVALAKGVDKSAEDKAKRKVDDVVTKLKAKGADFAAIAKAESEDAQTAARGGEIGWVTEAQMVAGIRDAATGLAKDAVSEPIRMDDGWHIVKMLDKKDAGTRPLADVRDAIVTQLRAVKARELRQAYLAKLLEQNPPAINELMLSKVLEKSK